MSEKTIPTRGPGPHTQGGGQRGGPRRWTGTGPRPARHIPWPELFKHHQSVLTGHLKMMDMVRKHCVEGTGNYITAQACVDRTHEMMRMFKNATATFVPPRDNIERVPLGASSASMYPGYSPADHIYGEAAAEYGAQVAEARKQGIEIKSDPEGPEYTVAQSHQQAREQLDEIKRQREEAKIRKDLSGRAGGESSRIQSDPMEGVEETPSAEPLFVIDSNPTPVHILGESTHPTTTSKGKNKANDKAKRRVSFIEEQSSSVSSAPPADSHKSKKTKGATRESKVDVAAASASKDAFEEEVESRHKAKEAKRKAKEEKKRKRESDSSQIVEGEVNPAIEVSSSAGSKKKKYKSSHEQQEPVEVMVAAGTEKKRENKKRPKPADEIPADAQEIGAKQKKKKTKHVASP